MSSAAVSRSKADIVCMLLDGHFWGDCYSEFMVGEGVVVGLKMHALGG